MDVRSKRWREVGIYQPRLGHPHRARGHGTDHRRGTERHSIKVHNMEGVTLSSFQPYASFMQQSRSSAISATASCAEMTNDMTRRKIRQRIVDGPIVSRNGSRPKRLPHGPGHDPASLQQAACRHAAVSPALISRSGTVSRRRINRSTGTRESRRPGRARYLPQRGERLQRPAGKGTRPSRPDHGRRRQDLRSRLAPPRNGRAR